MLKKSFTLVILVALIFGLVASTGLRSVKAQGKTYKIAISIPDLAFPFFVIMAKQMQDEAKKLGEATVDVLGGRNDPGKQTAVGDSGTAPKYDGFFESPTTADSMAPAVKEVVDAGIPV